MKALHEKINMYAKNNSELNEKLSQTYKMHSLEISKLNDEINTLKRDKET